MSWLLVSRFYEYKDYMHRLNGGRGMSTEYANVNISKYRGTQTGIRNNQQKYRKLKTARNPLKEAHHCPVSRTQHYVKSCKVKVKLSPCLTD